MRSVFLEGINRSVDIVGCRAGEFSRIMEHATRLLASDGDELLKVVEDIVDAWAPGLDAEQLTLDDAWNILIAKAGRAKGENLANLPKAFAKQVLDFLQSPEGAKLMRGEAEKILNSHGEDI